MIFSPDSPQGNKYMVNHCTAEEEWGGGLITLLAFGRSSPTASVLGIIFRSAGRHPKKLILKVTARPQIQLW